MPKRLSMQPHLSVNDLERRDRAAQDPIARSHWQMIWLLAQGRTSAQGAASPGYRVKWLRTVAQRDNQDGPASLGDRRHRHPGHPGV